MKDPHDKGWTDISEYEARVAAARNQIEPLYRADRAGRGERSPRFPPGWWIVFAAVPSAIIGAVTIAAALWWLFT